MDSRFDCEKQPHTSEFRLLRLWMVTLLATASMLLFHGACDCGGGESPSDAGETIVVPEKKVSSKTQIRFISPLSNDIISGQITIEAEVIDSDGMERVTFYANDKVIGQGSITKDSTRDKPRYAVQVATSFLPRGVLSLTVRTADLKGEKAEKTIQVITRERWVAAFGVGTVRQMFIRDDRHIYVRLFRSKDDLARVTNPGPRSKVGAALITSNAVGAASWMYLGAGEDFGEFVVDGKGSAFFGARGLENSQTRLVAIGPGDTKWGPEIPITPKWEVDLKELLVQGKPIRWAESLWVHLVKAAQGGSLTRHFLARFKADDGTEEWRYPSQNSENIEIVRGPYLFGKGMILLLTRKSGASKGFRAEVVDSSGKQVWSKEYPNVQLNVARWDAKGSKLYIGVEQRESSKVTASSLFCIDPAGKKECWSKDLGNRWPSHISQGGTTLCVGRNPGGSEVEVTLVKLTDGSDVWTKKFSNRRMTGLLALSDDACFVFSEVLDDSGDPDSMLVERYSAKGNINWRYSNSQFTSKKWMFVPSIKNTLWIIVRGTTDDVERLGSKLIALDERGKRLYIFLDENRIFDLLWFYPKDSLFVTSRDLRDARVHHLIPIR